MIRLHNQLALQFFIGEIPDFIDAEDFHYLRIAENAGGLRPIIDMQFTTKDQEVINYLNSGNVITLMYGMKEPISNIMQFEIWNDSKTKEYKAGSITSIGGALYNRSFTSQPKSEPLYNCSSVDAIKQIAVRNKMNFVTNVTKTFDKQTWYPSGKTDWGFLDYIANRAYLDNSTFFIYAFDCDSIYFYDVKQLLQSDIKWYFTVQESSANTQSNIINIGSYQCSDATAGTNASLIGRNVVTHSYNLDTGEFLSPKFNLRSFTTMDTDNININSTDSIDYEYNITTSDEHNFSIAALKQNKKNQILYSSYTCHTAILNDYYNFKLLDTVLLIPNDTDKEAEGLYFITGIAKSYQDNQYKTILTLNRESANGIRGNLEKGT